MAIPVARVHLAMAHAALPALLPTPPKCKMLPLLPTPPCIAINAIILLPTSPPKPSRADAAERWDARKNAIALPSKPGRADAVERWDDARKAMPPSPASSVSSQRSSDSKSSSHRGRASSSSSSSSERWDANKKSSPPPPPLQPSSRSPVSRAPCSVAARRGSKRSAAHKKQPRPAPAEEVDDGVSSTGSNDVELDMPRRRQRAPYAGPGFLVAAPEPSVIPMPSSFMVRVAA